MASYNGQPPNDGCSENSSSENKEPQNHQKDEDLENSNSQQEQLPNSEEFKSSTPTSNEQLQDLDSGNEVITQDPTTQDPAQEVTKKQQVPQLDAGQTSAISNTSIIREDQSAKNTITNLENIQINPKIGPTKIDDLIKRMEYLEEIIQIISKQISFIPPQVRTLTNKVNGLDTSISEPKYQNILKDVLLIYDLVDQSLKSLVKEDEKESRHQQNYDCILTQIKQILSANGLFPISTEGIFDPTLHKAIKCIPVAKEHNGKILEVIRTGFRTANAILRYSEVVIGKFSPPGEINQKETLDE